MGALPSRETQRRGLYSHRHGRTRRSEIILVPLTAEFFPHERCPLFERLYQARHRRTAKYYYRAVRTADTDWNTDYYCQTTAHVFNIDLNDPDGPNKDSAFEANFSDSVEGLYHRLVKETEYCLCDTDEELRQRYREQLAVQRKRQSRKRRASCASVDASGCAGLNEDDLTANPYAYAAGYVDALTYAKGKEYHTQRNKSGVHVTSPDAFYLRPVPCAIVSRYESNQPLPEDGVEFLGAAVKVLGMFGLLPSTIPGTVDGEVVDQHMLKAAMFVDKDVGDQILGNVVMLGVHMYVRQCMEAQIRAPFIPMIPFMLRAPISNVPILQFIREMRVRLKNLLEAGLPIRTRKSTCGTARGASGEGSSGSVPCAENTTEGVDAPTMVPKRENDVFLFEEDVPGDVPVDQIFADVSETQWLRGRPAKNTNPDRAIPFLLMSGVNVQTTPLTHDSLHNTAHIRVPEWFTNGVLGASSSSLAGDLPHSQRSDTRTAQLLARRRSRFRIWVQDGHLCIWASAAYARRGCLILAQQLMQTVDNNVLSAPRPWNYRGLLRGGMPMPAPTLAHDVFIVAHDMPSLGLYQGDILRCSTAAEVAERLQKDSPSANSASPQCGKADVSFAQLNMSPSFNSTAIESLYSSGQLGSSSANALLRDRGEAPPNAFWVCCPAERETATTGLGEKKQRGSVSDTQQTQDAATVQTTNVEDVLLFWIKTISLRTRDAYETDEHWVRVPTTGSPLKVDRYVISRIEHDGMRYFMGVTPRFVGQQRRLEKVLGDIKAQEQKEDQEDWAPLVEGNDVPYSFEDAEGAGCVTMAHILSTSSSVF
ncbi:hypothetical protein ERJ75_001043600 [Trypanosoma vivax]|uniref:Uncharacterized protein n=1 Tax=Trypanosoma vivax (strain Y486) TaxID=1055687 RepID=G0TZS6_TRYVY|nr:hypothetical protein ERJ75_001043600 [Trypanosoma vivax]CCC50104.1 conserved hypothetical protein [Trypanosoma vivax Y486]